MKAAVYAGTRNVYEDMIPSMKSLLIHSDVDKIYFLIEDNEFPYELPPEVECINISNQPWFDKDGPNYANSWSYIILLRAAYTKIFPNLDTILSLDNDTIVNGNISDLWDIPMENYYIAGVKEPKKSKRFLYVNSGVLLFNLKKIREDKKDDELIQDLNTYIRLFPEQECFNEILQDKILEISADYNINNYTKAPKCSKIIHFAANKNWNELPIVQKYKNMEIIRNQFDNEISLDIIIPFYNNINGLEDTLKSVVFPDLKNLNVTVVDDCSSVDYEDLKELYPTVNFLRLEQNNGPGIARQFGIDNTSNTYIMFIDTADYILSKYNLIEVLETIKENSIPYMHLWRWLNAEHNTYSSDWNPLLHGWVIKREFLKLYNITFSKEGSRSNEDYGFIQSCNIMLKNIALNDKTPYFAFHNSPIYMYIYDTDSITHKDNKIYMYTTHIKGLSTNGLHVYNFCKKNNIHHVLTMQLMAKTLIQLYQDFLTCAKNKPEYLKDNWIYLRKFYLIAYKPYEKIGTNFLYTVFNNRIPNLLKLTNIKIPKINLIKFIQDLNNYEECPY